MLQDDKIDPADYKLMKTENEAKIKRLEDEITATSSDKTNITVLIEEMVNQAMRIVPMYSKKSVEFQRQFINIIYPRKLTHFEGGYRTPKTNPRAAPISPVNKELTENKNEKEPDFSRLSHYVIPLVKISNTFVDLKRTVALGKSIPNDQDEFTDINSP